MFIETLNDQSGAEHFALGILAAGNTPAGWKAIEVFSNNSPNSMHRGTARWYL